MTDYHRDRQSYHTPGSCQVLSEPAPHLGNTYSHIYIKAHAATPTLDNNKDERG